MWGSPSVGCLSCQLSPMSWKSRFLLVGVHVSSLDVSESVCRGCRVDMATKVATKVMSICEMYYL